MASTSTVCHHNYNSLTSSDPLSWTQTEPELPIYLAGVRIPSNGFEELIGYVRSLVKQQLPTSNLVPTTYEESRAYLGQQGGKFDPLREMCLVIAVDIPKNQEILMMTSALGICQKLESGSNMFVATMLLPPNAFGSPEDRTCSALVNTTTSKPVQANEVRILTAYFTKKRDATKPDTSDAVSKKKKNKNKRKKNKKKGTAEDKGEEEVGEEREEEETVSDVANS
ncbi:hypothetical protein GALMADRAFT_225342 [Galerina marginata CBS 339.88]|uniref:Uncharacterized protein n=1 Tax=Galerina marginata (strain CBS 339.88) TaxID=685588 RepID=A0A067TBE6_GALM3|nr:hypothetical protein GALMADRAFT_225342 [Galerina marginata CBS 339.88]